jgi:hypothetical protein
VVRGDRKMKIKMEIKRVKNGIIIKVVKNWGLFILQIGRENATYVYNDDNPITKELSKIAKLEE